MGVYPKPDEVQDRREPDVPTGDYDVKGTEVVTVDEGVTSLFR